MKLLMKLFLVAVGHTVFLFVFYATAGFHLTMLLPPVLLMLIWVVASSIVAFFLNYSILLRSSFFSSRHTRRLTFVILSIVATFLSFYLGMYASLNTFGE